MDRSSAPVDRERSCAANCTFILLGFFNTNMLNRLFMGNIFNPLDLESINGLIGFFTMSWPLIQKVISAEL